MHKIKVFTTIECDENDKKNVHAFLTKKLMGEKYEIEYLIDSKILGGIKLLVDDKLYDNSLSFSLAKLKEIIK